MSPTDDRYWAEYDGLQHAKHQLLRKYLGGWLPILASWSGRVLYVDCHAGRGRHKTGHEGSPLLALRLLLGHRRRTQILASTQVRFIFFEINQTNYDLLLKEINALGQLPIGVEVDPYHDDYENAIRWIIDNLQSRGKRLAPTFAFLDPYGFKLSMNLLNDLLSFPQCEILINFMYRYVDMAIHNPSQTANMDSLFGCPHWHQLIDVEDYDERAEKIIALFSSQLRADYVTHMYMRAENRALKYVLFHATNHRRGREVMKGAMWAVTPDGSFTAFERHAPDQYVLIVPDPDLEPLKKRLWTRFAGQQVRMKEIYDWLVGELFLESHLHKALRNYRKRSIVDFSDYSGRFAFSKNPLVSFPSQRPVDS